MENSQLSSSSMEPFLHRLGLPGEARVLGNSKAPKLGPIINFGVCLPNLQNEVEGPQRGNFREKVIIAL